MMAADMQNIGGRSLTDFGFWEEAWQQTAKIVLRSRRGEGKQAQVNFWNKRAEEFTSRVMPDAARVAEIVDWLKAQGVTLAGARVLDIGSGPGAFTLPFARAGAKVVALEPAEAMVSALEELMAREKLKGSIQVYKGLWEDVDLEAEGWRGSFDLVFASMSPGINSWETIEKALNCSRQYCYFSSFAGERFNDHYVKLWEILYGHEMPPWPADIIFVNQLLLLRGYDVTFHVWNRRRPEAIPVEDGVEEFKKFFLQYGQEVPHMEEEIRTYLKNHLSEGLFKHEINTRLGKILVKL
jgi:SAM-dependent methyltransferase